jgi:flagellar FliJ protein
VKRFSFGLQKVLELREYREQEAKIELGRAIGVLTEIENRMKQNAAQKSEAAAKRFASIGGAGGGEMQAWDNFILRLEQESCRLTDEAAAAELAVEEKRGLYLEASREVKAMEKLKEKREKEYRKEMFSAETAALDDLRRRENIFVQEQR